MDVPTLARRCARLLSKPMTPPPPAEDSNGLATIIGASLGCTSVVMAPVPFLGTAFALAGLILSIIGRRSGLRGATAFGIWSNAIGLSVGLVVTLWFVWKFTR